MRRLLILVPVAVVCGALAIPALAATKSVKVGDDFFVRDGGVPTVTVKKNDTVKWNFVGDSPHNVTVKSGPTKFHSKTMSSGSFSKKLTKKGLYTLYCTIHGQAAQSMKLRVK
jgi:plastocyanin